MIFTPPSLSRLLSVSSFSLLLLLAAGCASDEGRPPRGAGRHREHFPTMAGHETFFNGGITTEILVGAMTGFSPAPPGAGSGGGDGHGSHHGGGGGMHMHGGGGGGGGGHGPRSGGGGGEPAPSGDEDPGRHQAMVTQRAANQGSPPVMIHLRFINNGTEKADVTIADFLSPLGNFAVQPERFTLQPGEALAVEPMTSRLAGEISGGEITLSLKLGGVTETKTIGLELQPEAEPTPNVQANPTN